MNPSPSPDDARLTYFCACCGKERTANAGLVPISFYAHGLVLHLSLCRPCGSRVIATGLKGRAGLLRVGTAAAASIEDAEGIGSRCECQGEAVGSFAMMLTEQENGRAATLILKVCERCAQQFFALMPLMRGRLSRAFSS